MEPGKAFEEGFSVFLMGQEPNDGHDVDNDDMIHDMSKWMTALIHLDLRPCHFNVINSIS